MSIYEKTARELMHEFAVEKLKPGQLFTRQDAVRWFSEHYPNLRSTTVQRHVEGMAVNSRIRKHNPNIKAGAGWDLFYQLGPREFRLWDREHDPAPKYKSDIEEGEEEALSGTVAEFDGTSEDAAEDIDSRKFAFERDLQNYLARNLPLLEPGLRLFEDEDGQFNGIEFPAGQRYIDILAVGGDDAFVVIELKVSRAYDRVIGQLLRYMGWVKENLAGEAPVRGIIVASDISNDLRLAASFVDNVSLVEYEISFVLKSV